jgi:transcriptional regulator with XRE-family HTH domain
MAVDDSQAQIGSRLRTWRHQRRLSQLELALDAGVSPRHLSFVETGRSKPGRELLLRVTGQLEVPIRERNELLLAAGYAPAFPERSLSDPELAPVRQAIDVILAAHEPNPAVVLDRYWNVVAGNSPMRVLSAWVDPDLLEPPVNAMRVGLHPRGLARWITNLGEVRRYFLGRLERQVALTADPRLVGLLDDVAGYPWPDHEPAWSDHEPERGAETEAGHILTPTMRLRAPDGRELSFFATVATFGTAAEVTTSELSIELAFPGDAATASALHDLTGG